MLFSSFEYLIVFLPIVLIGYHWLHARGWHESGYLWLTATSLVYYSYWNIRDLPILLASVTFNWYLGRVILATDKRWMKMSCLLGGIVIDFALLGYYKYAGFLVENLNAVTGSDLEFTKPILPLAISFFTFQQIAYLVDCYTGKGQVFAYIKYVLFVIFFPQFIAGPIVHHDEMMPQFEKKYQPGEMSTLFSLGMFRFSIGLFKKVILADTFSIWANAGYGAVDELTFATAWMTTLAYTLQLYFDFSGYSDMAIGSGLMFGIRLPENFNSPYRAVDIKDFWRRWHITLGRWLRDYLYIPLGGNRNGAVNMLFAITLTFVLGGLWHGASWNFVIWGGLHGLAYIVLWMWGLTALKMPNWTARIMTFFFIHLTWIFFRATTFSDAVFVIKTMLGWGSGNLNLFDGLELMPCGYEAIAAIAGGLGIVFLFSNSLKMEKSFHPNLKNLLLFLIATSAALIRLSFHDDFAEFLYFNF